MADEITTSGESLNDAATAEPEPVETEEEKQAREESEAKAKAEAEAKAIEDARLAAEAEHVALIESQKPEALRLSARKRAGEAIEEDAAALAALDPEACSWAEAELNEQERLAAEAAHAALIESQKPEAIRLLTAVRAGTAGDEDVAAAFAVLDPAACSWAEAELNEQERLAKAESQKEQAFRCWHHIMTSPKPRDEVRQHLLLLEPEALAYGKEKIEAELAALALEKAEAEAAGFSVPVTPAEASEHAAPKKRGGGRGR